MDPTRLREFLDDFLRIYVNRPIRSNAGGMGLNHSFGLYAVLRLLKPSLVVESGVWRGQSTWLIEQAVPASTLICLDPRPDLRTYTSPNARYETADFAGIDWTSFDTSDALCFFDDHQNAYARLMDMRWWGFRHAIMEDNFPVGQGDCYSLRHVLHGAGHPHIQMSPAHMPTGRRLRHRKREESTLRNHYWRQQMVRDPNEVDAAALRRNISCYLELPPVMLNPWHNWGGEWSGDYSTRTDAVFSSEDESAALRAILAGLEHLERERELAYGYACYVELRS